MARRIEKVGGVKFRLVTTMNAKGWEESGRRMVESVIANWPAETLPIVVYAEGFDPAMPAVEVRPMPSWLVDFKARFGRTAAHNGQRSGGYDYRFDAIKFSHKVAALTDFLLGLVDGEIGIWLDADTFTHAAVTAVWLENLFPEPAYIAWLDRHNTHPECGFLMFRTSHPYHVNFVESFRALYVSGRLFKLSETHDSYALWYMVQAKVMSGKLPTPVSLSGDKRWHHPFVNGPLGACIDHMKGPTRKAIGRSRPEDMRVRRTEKYWSQG